MALLNPPRYERPVSPARIALVIAAAVVGLSAIGVVAGLALRITHHPERLVTERREVAAFSTVELAGTNDVRVRVGTERSVTVTAEERVVDHVTTIVRGGRLVIGDVGSFTSTRGMNVAVSVPSLDAVRVSGTGAVTVEGVQADEFVAELSGAGTGTLRVSGAAPRLTAVLAGTGTVALHDLDADHVVARLGGTGTISVSAASTLDATLTGDGSIVYRGSPSVTSHITGTGSVARG